jgi:hypothetical protein
MEEARLRRDNTIPKYVAIRFANFETEDLVSGKIQDIDLHKSMVKAGPRLLFPTLDRDLLCYLRLTPSQIKPNDWRYFLSYCILWPLVLGEDTSLTLKKFLFVYRPVRYNWLWNFQV